MTGVSPPSRRRASRPRPSRDAAGLTAVGLVAVAAAAVALTLPAPGTSTTHGTRSGEPVTHTVVGCPGAQARAGTRTTFAAGVAPGPGLGSHGSVRQGTRGGSGSPVTVGRGQLSDLKGVASGSVLTGDGQLAAGLFGFRSDRSRSAGTLAVAPCTAPRGTWWFSGAGAGLDHSSELELSNVDVSPAVVDLDVLGPDGTVKTVGTRGLTIAPGASQRINLSDIAPQTDELTLGIRASRGRVVASVSDGFAASAGGALGREWLNGDTAPTRVLSLAGLPDKASSHTLLIANPSDSEAVVEVRVSGRDGEFVPAGMDEQTVAPGSVASVPLDKSVGRNEAIAVRVRSQVPILATVRSTVGDDTTYAAHVVPLTGPAAAPILSGVRGTLQLTAGARPAKASLVAYDDRGSRVDGKRISLDPTSTVAWSPAKKASYVVVTPVSGQLLGAMVYQGGGVSEAPLTTLPIRYVQPAVVPAVR